MHRLLYLTRLLADAAGIFMALIAWAATVPAAWLRARALRAGEPEPGCRLLLLQPNVARAIIQHGPELIAANVRLGAATYTCVLDPRGELEHESEYRELRFVSWKAPAWADALQRWGLYNTAFLLGEIPILFRMLAFAARGGFTVVKSNMHNEAALRGWLVSALLRRPHIIDIAGNYDLIERISGVSFYLNSYYGFRLLRPAVRAISRWLIGVPVRRAFRVLGRNKNNYEHAFALGASIERLSLLRIRLPAEFLEFEPGSVPQRPIAERYILFVARLSVEKRPEDAIEAFDRLAGEYPDVQLVIIGDGPLRPSVEARARRSPYGSRIRLTGALPNMDVLRWTAHAALAIELYSGSSLVEKMLCGVPVVAYDIEWMSEVVIDGYTGFSVDYLDLNALSRRGAELLSNPRLAGELASRARSLARAMFDLRRINEREDGYLREADAWCREGWRTKGGPG
jgi:glycosyltransferase involved in cell wall biosynthesis